jgi:hypothetical protein
MPVLPITEWKRGSCHPPGSRPREIFIDEGFELVMRRHFVALAAFLMRRPRQRLPCG